LFMLKAGTFPRPVGAQVRAKPLLPNSAGTLPELNGYGSNRPPSRSGRRCNPPKAPSQAGGPRDATPERPLVGVQPCIGDAGPARKVLGMPPFGGDEKSGGNGTRAGDGGVTGRAGDGGVTGDASNSSGVGGVTGEGGLEIARLLEHCIGDCTGDVSPVIGMPAFGDEKYSGC